MIDRYLWGGCSRISPEAPVQVLDVDQETSVLGGAGNVVSNLRSLGADVHVIGLKGDDLAAFSLEVLLEKEGVTFDLVVDASRRTTVKTRLMASNHQIVRFDQESSQAVGDSVVAHVLRCFEDSIEKSDIVLISDYGKGLLTSDLTARLIKTANQRQKRVLVDPKGSDFSKYKGAFLLTPNKQEASLALGVNIADDESLLAALSKMKVDCDLDVSLVTLSEHGIAVLERRLEKYPTLARQVYDVTGAGDTVLASLGFGLSAGLTTSEAVVFANYAAAVVVGKIGSSAATIDEIMKLQGYVEPKPDFPKVLPISEVSILVSRLRAQGKSVVFTNGCFDILHVGHVKYLQKASACGDVLVVGINSDQSVRNLKGLGRPINSAEDRAFTVSALESVDFVVIFDDDTPYDLICLLQPDVLVKGGDYEGKKVVGQDVVDDLRIVDFEDGYSTSLTIKRVRDNDRAC